MPELDGTHSLISKRRYWREVHRRAFERSLRPFQLSARLDVALLVVWYGGLALWALVNGGWAETMSQAHLWLAPLTLSVLIFCGLFLYYCNAIPYELHRSAHEEIARIAPGKSAAPLSSEALDILGRVSPAGWIEFGQWPVSSGHTTRVISLPYASARGSVLFWNASNPEYTERYVAAFEELREANLIYLAQGKTDRRLYETWAPSVSGWARIKEIAKSSLVRNGENLRLLNDLEKLILRLIVKFGQQHSIHEMLLMNSIVLDARSPLTHCDLRKELANAHVQVSADSTIEQTVRGLPPELIKIQPRGMVFAMTVSTRAVQYSRDQEIVSRS